MNVDVSIPDVQDDGVGDTEIPPLPVSGGIDLYVRSYTLECRSRVEEVEKLATKMIYWRIERRQRAAMRERRKRRENIRDKKKKR